MTREIKSVLIVVLIVLLYGGFVWFEQGAFVPPLPIFDILITVLAVRFALWNSEQKRWGTIAVVLALLNLFSTPTIWSFFLNGEQLYMLYESPLLDILRLGYFIGLLSVIVFSALKQRSPLTTVIAITAAVIHIYGAISGMFWLITITYLLLFISSRVRSAFPPFDLLWFLLFFFDGLFWLLTTL